MLYSLAVRPSWPVADRRARYRIHHSGLVPRTHWRALRRLVPPAPQSPPSLAETRVRQRDAGARWAHIMALNAQLSAALDNEGLEVWLALERALHAYWLEVALDHYALGYDAGHAQAKHREHDKE